MSDDIHDYEVEIPIHATTATIQVRAASEAEAITAALDILANDDFSWWPEEDRITAECLDEEEDGDEQ